MAVDRHPARRAATLGRTGGPRAPGRGVCRYRRRLPGRRREQPPRVGAAGRRPAPRRSAGARDGAAAGRHTAPHRPAGRTSPASRPDTRPDTRALGRGPDRPRPSRGRRPRLPLSRQGPRGGARGARRPARRRGPGLPGAAVPGPRGPGGRSADAGRGARARLPHHGIRARRGSGRGAAGGRGPRRAAPPPVGLGVDQHLAHGRPSPPRAAVALRRGAGGALSRRPARLRRPPRRRRTGAGGPHAHLVGTRGRARARSRRGCSVVLRHVRRLGDASRDQRGRALLRRPARARPAARRPRPPDAPHRVVRGGRGRRRVAPAAGADRPGVCRAPRASARRGVPGLGGPAPRGHRLDRANPRLPRRRHAPDPGLPRPAGRRGAVRGGAVRDAGGGTASAHRPVGAVACRRGRPARRRRCRPRRIRAARAAGAAGAGVAPRGLRRQR